MTDLQRQAIAADTVFDGTALRRDHAVIFAGADIIAVRPQIELSGLPVRRLPAGAWLVPGFIDAQVNGGGNVLFNDTPTADGIAAIVTAHRRFGTTALLPTLISDSPEKMQQASAAVAAAAPSMPEVVGIHFEGPFLSRGRPGIHDPNMFGPPIEDAFEVLTQHRPGATLVTLAPECVRQGFVARLVQIGIRVALGHSMATYEQTQAAMREGLTGFTHLFNAMRPLTARDPGPIAAALEEPGAFYGLIVDGEHVAPPVLRLALRGRGQPMLVTDAMPPVGGTASSFLLAGKQVEVRDGRCTAGGVLAGSALDMASAVRNCVRLLGLPLEDALCLATVAPASFLGLAQRHGRLAPGCRADAVALDPNTIRVLGTWVAGKEFAAGSG